MRPDHKLEKPVLAPMIFAHNKIDDETIQLIKAAYLVDPYYKDPTMQSSKYISQMK